MSAYGWDAHQRPGHHLQQFVAATDGGDDGDGDGGEPLRQLQQPDGKGKAKVGEI